MAWVESPIVDVDLDVPVGERYQRLPPNLVARGKDLLDAVMAQVPAWARPVADGVRARTANHYHAECCALADRHGAGWRDVMLANISYDLAIAALGCSTAAIPTPSGPVVARNMDWFPEDLLARASCLLRFRSKGAPAFSIAGWPASVGSVTGVSARGFAVIINAVSSPERYDLAGYPVLLFLRNVLEEAADFRDALERLTKQRLVTSGLITLVGSTNEERVVIERSPTRHALRWGEPGKALVTTNHYRTLYSPEEGSGFACVRYERLNEILQSSETEPTQPKLMAAISDPGVTQVITAQQILIWPRTGEMKLFVPRHLVA